MPDADGRFGLGVEDQPAVPYIEVPAPEGIISSPVSRGRDDQIGLLAENRIAPKKIMGSTRLARDPKMRAVGLKTFGQGFSLIAADRRSSQ